ncbi:DUF998 domain-containing protein [Bailinhaonella thermotolerans]|uniref:DUF998 domain-containing protein n=1 Tax=Bailinhaonella thermotolerans TaxID=1070861 RepID=A0A3A4B7J5_9ACTN|nr:DUF998 domain-containing protein [Bailinhaonella thermotolerans]RJL30078.1 DUF998 domain-containing protein [Bailinhaonella thermotolerans]
MKPRPLALISGLGLASALFLALAGHVQGEAGLTAFGHTISDFAAGDRGGSVETGMFLAGAASLVLLAGLRAAAAPLSRTVAGLLLVWVGGVIAGAVIPTTPAGLDLTASGYVHRYVSFAAFIALPVAGILMARRFRTVPDWRPVATPVLSLALATGAGGLAMLTTSMVGHRVLIGLAERVLALTALALLGVLAHRLHRLSAAGARSVTA